jgi:Domain of unknown function (DUF5753)
MSVVTTEPAPTRAFSPMVTQARIVDPEPAQARRARTTAGSARARVRGGHLLAAQQLPRLRLGIIPAGAPYRVPLHNGFWILDEAVVQFDTYAAELSLVRPDEIALYGRAFERLAALAVYGAEARTLVTRALDRLGTRIM